MLSLNLNKLKELKYNLEFINYKMSLIVNFSSW